MSDAQMSGKLVLITAATSGIGFVTAKTLAARGASLILVSATRRGALLLSARSR